MKVLVTGGAGFIGYHLARRLADEGHKVVICDNLSRGIADQDLKRLTKDRVEFIESDLTDKFRVDELPRCFDIVYHLAAVNGTKNFYERPHEVLRANVLSLINILDWARHNEHKRIVWTSSSETYAGTPDIPIPTPEEVPLTVADVINPRFSYAGSKIVGELFCLSYAKAYGLDISIVRPHNVYGPRMGYDHVIPQFIERIQKKENPFKIYGAMQSRAFCFVDDFVDGLILIGKLTGTTILNLGNYKEETNIVELARKIFDITGFFPELKILPPPEGSVARRCPDILKVKTLTGYDPKISLDEGLSITYDWYRR